MNSNNQLIDAFNNLPKIQLNGHNDYFYNELEYNDLVNFDGSLLYFVSTNEKKEQQTDKKINDSKKK